MERNAFPMTSPLIAPELEAQLRQLLENITQPVSMTCILDDGAKSAEMAAFLNHFAGLSPLLNLEFYTPQEAPQLADRLNARLLPATGIGKPDGTPRMIFHGIPGGKEISSFATAVLTAGGGARELDKYTLRDIGKIKRPMNLEVCVSLACHHCAQTVAACQRIAWENPLVTAHMIDANLYPDLVRQYAIERVPLTVLDGSQMIPGGKTLAEMTTLLARQK